MNNAVIAQIGTPRQLYEAPSDAFVADFIGEANILDCQIESVAGNLAQVRLGDIVMQLPALNLGAGQAQLAIRPRRVALHTEDTAGTLSGKLLKSTYVGTHMEYRIGTAHGEIFAISGDVDTLHRAGSDIRVGFRDPGPVLIPAT
ncbi:MAG TPA: TOBE domain-containing protein, partial [Afifellaceae bacterium]|nr:TOBE domain-containing protein [Afifellaceae bacterium]